MSGRGGLGGGWVGRLFFFLVIKAVVLENRY